RAGSVRCREGRVDLAWLPGDEDLDLQTQAGALAIGPPALSAPAGAAPPDPRQALLEQLKSLTRQLASQMAEAGDVPARPGQARDQAALLGIGNGDEHHRYRRGRLLEGLREVGG